MTTEPSFPGLTAAARTELDALLRRCVQCGLCLPVCATWLATGDETQGPRGRLQLLGEALTDAAVTRDPQWRAALDTCIGCQACSAVCPSGVPFPLLAVAVEAARTPAAAAGIALAPGLLAPLQSGLAAPLRAALLRRLEEPAWLRALGVAAAVGRAVSKAAPGAGAGVAKSSRAPLGALRRLAGSVPRAPRGDRALARSLDALVGGPATRVRALPRPPVPIERVIWFPGCANEGLLPDSSRRLRELLTWAGADLRILPGTTCCGALADHTGRPAAARARRERNRAAWGDGAGAACLVTEAAGCGAAIRAGLPAPPVPQVDAIVWLSASVRPPFGPVPLRVALHDPCHARHAQGIVREPRALLRAIPGLTLCEPAEPDVCCGSGGAWSLDHGDLAAELGARKARLLAATGADLVVTANPGCLGQLAGALATLPGGGPPILPLGDLLWYAAVRAGQP